MIASMGAFAMADTLVKMATSSLSPAQVLFFLTSGSVFIFTAIATLQGNRLIDTRAFSSVLIVRYAAEIIGMIGMVTALALVPISSVGAITQASPILAVTGAALFLKEPIGWRRWSSITIGFIGVVLIIQPGAMKFDIAILWAVLALAGLSIRDLTTRMVPPDMGSASLAAYTMLAALPVTIGWVLINGESLYPASTNLILVAPMILLGAIGYLLLIASLRSTEVAIVMPFRYTRIIFLLLVGIIIFGERPNVTMLIGAALIVLAGSYMFWREQQVKHNSTAVGSKL